MCNLWTSSYPSFDVISRENKSYSVYARYLFKKLSNTHTHKHTENTHTHTHTHSLSLSLFSLFFLSLSLSFFLFLLSFFLYLFLFLFLVHVFSLGLACIFLIWLLLYINQISIHILVGVTYHQLVIITSSFTILTCPTWTGLVFAPQVLVFQVILHIHIDN